MATTARAPESAVTQQSMVTLLRELFYGPPKAFAFVLNPGDAGLLASLDKLSAEQASARPEGRSSIAAHVDHLAYGLSLVNRWARGEEDPFTEADYAASWTRQVVNDEQWRALRKKLADEAGAWVTAAGTPREWDLRDAERRARQHRPSRVSHRRDPSGRRGDARSARDGLRRLLSAAAAGRSR